MIFSEMITSRISRDLYVEFKAGKWRDLRISLKISKDLWNSLKISKDP
jgi:hypothetical protein